MALSAIVKVLIVEDQPAIRNYIKLLVEKRVKLILVGACGTVKEALQLINDTNPDLLLLDINLPDGTGFDILTNSSWFQFKVIFLTAYHEHALRAIKFGALDYLLKPIVDDEFQAALDKVFQSLPISREQFTVVKNEFKNGVHNRLVLRSQTYLQIVDIDDIIYCKSDAGYTQFFLSGDKNIIISKYIKEYEEILPAKKFLRPHQSYIVNLAFIDRYHKEGYLLLKNNIKIPVSVRRKEDVIDYLKKHPLIPTELSMAQFYKIIFLICLCCCKQVKNNTGTDLSSIPSDSMFSTMKKRMTPLIFNSNSKEMGRILDSLKSFAINGDPSFLAYWYELKNEQHFMEGNYDSSFYYLYEKHNLALENDFAFEDIIAIKAGLTRNLIIQFKMDSALRFALEGYYLGRKNNFVSLPINYHLFEIYSSIGDPQNAKKYLFEGYELSHHDPYFKVFFSAGLAKYYEEKGQADSALYYFRYLEKDTVFNSREFKASRDENMGVLLTSNGQPEQGLPYILRALPVQREIGPINGLTMLNLAICYSKLKQYKLSFAYLDSAAHYGDTIKDLSLAWQMLDLEAENYVGMQQFQKGYTAKESAFKLYKKEKDTLIAKNARDLETRYRLKEKEDKITSLAIVNQVESKISGQRKIIIVAMAIVMILVGTIVILLWRRRQMQIQIREAQLKQQLLRSQMEPHFMFNTLSVLQSFIVSEKPEKSIAFLNKFSRLLRINLENARESLVPLQKEIEALGNYFELNAMNFDNLFEYHIDIYQGYEEDDLLIPPMLLQPFVENAILHGLAQYGQKGLITVKIDKLSDALHCIIEDNGLGLNSSSNVNSKRSLSTIITQERLTLLSRQMGRPAKIIIIDKQGTNEGQGVRVTLDMPIIKSVVL